MKRIINYIFFIPLFIFIIVVSSNAENLLKVTFLNVDQGDAVTIQFPNGIVMQIDSGKGGAFSSGGSMGSRVVAPFLKENKIEKIDVAIATHPDFDHLGGFVDVFSLMPVGEYWESIGHTTNAYKNLLKLVRDKKNGYFLGYKMVKQRLEKLNAENYFGDDIKINILGPLYKYKDNNNASLSFMITYKNRTFMLCGDAGFEPLEDMAVKHKENLKSDFILVPHHGSAHNYNEKFLNFVKPEIAVISAGYENKFKHPRPEIIKAYHYAGAQLFRTDILQSHIQIITDGDDYKINLIPKNLKSVNLEFADSDNK